MKPFLFTVSLILASSPAFCGQAASTPAAPATAAAAVDAPMTFTVAKNEGCPNCVGVLAVGKLVAGTAGQFRRTVADQNTKGNHVSTVVFGSPGGVSSEGMELGRIIRRSGIDTGSLVCASACSLAFLGGVHRHASANSIGVHQFSNAATSKAYSAADVSEAQSVVALLLDYVHDMGVSADFVTTASETPPNEVHWLSSVEMKSLNVTTNDGDGDQAQSASMSRAQESSSGNGKSGRYIRTSCGGILDQRTSSEWYIGPDENVAWAVAGRLNSWVKSLRKVLANADDGGVTITF